MTNNKEVQRKNKIVAIILVIIAIISTIGSVLWLKMYAPLILQ